MAGLIPKSEFIGIESVAHLAAGGETPVLRTHVNAATQFLLDKGIGMPGRDRMFATAGRVRSQLGSILGVKPDDIAFLGDATEGVYAAAAGIDWRPGDNVVVERIEFPSLLHVWQGLPGRQVELRQVGETASPSLDEMLAAVDRQTRVIAVSHVSYLTGARHDLAALRAAADRVGARLVVDASHSLGVVQVPGALCDALVSCAYKWMLGTHGIGVFYVNSERWPDLAPPCVGWHSIVPEEDWRRRAAYRLKDNAERFESGNLAFLSLYLLENGLKALMSVGIDRIESHVLDLTADFRYGLEQLGLPVLTPEGRAQRAGNLAFATDRSEAVEAGLRADGVIAWAGDGRLRLSVHAYNDEQDIDRALDALRRLFK